MALVWIEGFETFGESGDIFSSFATLFRSKYSLTEPTTTAPLYTGYRGEGVGLKLSNSYSSFFCKSFANDTTWTVGVAVQITNSPNSFAEEIVTFCVSTSEQCQVRINSDYAVQFLRGTTSLEVTANDVVSLGGWYYIEVKVTIGDSGAYEVRLDGTTVLSGNDVDTKYQADLSGCDTIKFGPMYGVVDDIYILDSATGLNTFLGPCKVTTVYPVNDGSQNDWTPSTGGSNYAVVDETPVGSDYVSSKTNDDLDLFEVADVSGGTVKGAMLTTAATLDSAGVKEFSLIVDSNGSQVSEANQLIDTRLMSCWLLVEEDPNASTAWTNTTINAAEWGIKIT